MKNLRGGQQTDDPRLDRVREFDEKSRRYSVGAQIASQTRARSFTWSVGVWLDQGSEGACTGFSRAMAIAARPVPYTNITAETAELLYHRARQLDEWPGEDYDGSSVLGAVKAATELGFVRKYEWAFTLDEFLYGVGFRGPAVVGVNWYEQMQDTDPNGFIYPMGNLVGGHAIVVNRIKIVRTPRGLIDPFKSYVGFWNSWGPEWGDNGMAKMALVDFDHLRKQDGEICFATDVIPPKS